jgi:hypothetical protein
MSSFEDVKLMLTNSIDTCLKPYIDLSGSISFSGTIIQTFIPLTSSISTLEVYSGGGAFTIAFLDTTLQVSSSGWIPVRQNFQVTSCQEYTISVYGSGTIGTGRTYYGGTCSLGSPIAFKAHCEDIAVPVYSFELIDIQDLPKVAVEYSGRTRIITEYLSGNMLVEDSVTVEIYSRYPSEIDTIVSMLEEYFRDNYQFPGLLHVDIIGIEPITLTRAEMFARRIRLSLLRRV